MTEQTSTAVALRDTRPHATPPSVFSDLDTFAAGQRICGALVSSNLVPEAYRGSEKMGNALIALDIANRMGIPPLMVMQNLHVIEGRPSWASSFIISALNSCGLFSPIRFRIKDLGERDATYDKWVGPKGARTKETVKAKISDKEYVAYAVEKATGEILEGPPVTLSMAIAEGWYFRPGSKWVTMPDLMGRYRAAAFFGRLYAPHVLNGMPTADEAIEVDYEVVQTAPVAAPEATAEAKPADRPQGVHAALKRSPAKPKPTKKAEPAALAPAREPEPETEPEHLEADAGEEAEFVEGDDVFDAPGDEDYQPE